MSLIKELTIQALANCEPSKMTELSSSVNNGDGVDIPLEFSEKFAELLVEKCIHLCKEVGNVDWIEKPTFEEGILGCQVMLKQQFKNFLK